MKNSLVTFTRKMWYILQFYVQCKVAFIPKHLKPAQRGVWHRFIQKTVVYFEKSLDFLYFNTKRGWCASDNLSNSQVGKWKKGTLQSAIITWFIWVCKVLCIAFYVEAKVSVTPKSIIKRVLPRHRAAPSTKTEPDSWFTDSSFQVTMLGCLILAMIHNLISHASLLFLLGGFTSSL